jgi:putative membrane protein
MMWWYSMPGFGGFSGWWAWHMIGVTLFWLFFVSLIIIGAQRLTRPRRYAKEYIAGEGGILSALTILQERYARGEIGREEFLEKQRDLGLSSG